MSSKKHNQDELQTALKGIDWAKIDALTDDELELAALNDPDNPPLDDEQLARMRAAVVSDKKQPAAE